MASYFDMWWPLKFNAQKSELQKKLENQGCVFRGQELLANHEPDQAKPCQCGRPITQK